MSAYLVLKDIKTDTSIVVMSRVTPLVQYMTDNLHGLGDEYKRFEQSDLKEVFEDLKEDIFEIKSRIALELIKKDFETYDIMEDIEEYEEKLKALGSLKLINEMLYDNKDIQMSYG